MRQRRRSPTDAGRLRIIRDLSRRRLAVRAAAALTLTFAAQAPASAQRDTSQRTGGWLGRDVRQIGELTTAQRAAAIATLDRIERLSRQVPELANLDGFEIQPVILGGALQDGPGGEPMAGFVVEYSLSLWFFVPTMAIAGEGRACIEVRVNPIQSATLYDAQGNHIYIEPQRAMEPRGTPEQTAGILWQVPGATQVYGELREPIRDIREGRGERSLLDVLFVGAGELSWKPVTRAESFETRRFEVEGTSGEKLAGFRAGLAGKVCGSSWKA